MRYLLITLVILCCDTVFSQKNDNRLLYDAIAIAKFSDGKLIVEKIYKGNKEAFLFTEKINFTKKIQIGDHVRKIGHSGRRVLLLICEGKDGKEPRMVIANFINNKPVTMKFTNKQEMPLSQFLKNQGVNTKKAEEEGQ